MTNLKIRPLGEEDFAPWLPLWNGNNQGHRDEAVTAATWQRLIDPSSPVKGLGAFAGKTMAGLVHFIIHPVTGHIHPVCYMQDLYVDPAFRRQGIGRRLVDTLAALGQREKWARIYWLAESKNEAAQTLYRALGHKLDFTLHVLPL